MRAGRPQRLDVRGPRRSGDVCRPALGLVATAMFPLAATIPAAAKAQAIGQYVYGQLLDSEIPLTTATGRNQGVRDRIKLELLPQGLPLGSFRAYPKLTGGLGYTTNVVGAESGARADGYAELNPALTVQSQWSRHAVSATAAYDGLRFFNTSAKKQDGFQAEADGRIDILDKDQVFATASFRRSYEDQQEASFPLGGGGSVAVDQPVALLRTAWVFNRVRVTLSTDYNGFTYHDTVSTTGARIDLSYRNRDVYRGSVRLEYLLGEDNSVFAQATYRRTDYRTSVAINDRTSDEWRGSVGVIADVTQLVRVAGAAGYFRRTYPSPLFRAFSGVALDLRADYYVTPLTTLTAIVSREPEESSITGSSGYIQTRVGIRADHELLRTLIPFVYADYSPSKFKGVDRRDRVVDAGGGVDYMANRRLTVSFTTVYVTHDSHGVERGPDVNELRGLFSIRYHP